MAELEALKEWIPEIDAVLISHPDLPHLGGLPYAVGKLGLKAPIYSTIPVYKMGLMFMYDAFEARKKDEDFDLWDLDDVDAAFDNITQLKYSQHFRITTDHTGEGAIFVTPYAAGNLPLLQCRSLSPAFVHYRPHDRGYCVEDREGN